MKLVKFVALAGALIFPTIAQANQIEGVWLTQKTKEGRLQVKMQPCGSKICGTIIRAIGPDGVSGDYPHIGRKMISGMSPDGANKWAGGKIWDPRRDQNFSSTMELKGNSLKVSGCFLAICQTQTWKRAK